MGLFDFLKKGKSAKAEPEPDSQPDSEPEAPVVAVVVLRAGMSDPDEDYARAILAEHFPEALERALPVHRLSQPRWFKAEFIQGGLRTTAQAMAQVTDTDPASATFIVCVGPDGAPAALVLMRR